jgi:hypothetical protein
MDKLKLSSWLKYQKLLPLLWLALAGLVLAIDYVDGPILQFPILFVIPVLLASWYSGRWWGLGLAVSLSLVRMYFSVFWDVPILTQYVPLNTLIRIIVLSLLAYLTDRVATQSRALAQEIRVLQGLLPICSFCKRIRDESGAWQPLETYITGHSEAVFSHSLCEECAKIHYPEIFSH